jgi:hypothetical protein
MKLENYTVVRHTEDPSVMIHSFIIKGVKHFAIDTWIPTLSDNMSNDDKLSAYESAMGFRLRSFKNPEDATFISPSPVNRRALLDLIRDNMDEMRHSPIYIGFQYDGHAPGEASVKNSDSIIRYLQDIGAENIILSTAYRPNGHIWGTSLRGSLVLELRLTGLNGVNTIGKKHIPNILRRMDYYGHASGWIARIGPMTGQEDNPISFISLFGVRGDDMGLGGTVNVIGLRMWMPEEPLIPSEYIDLLSTCRKLSIVPPEEMREGKFNESKVFDTVIMDVGRGFCFEVFGSDCFNKHSTVLFQKGAPWLQPGIYLRHNPVPEIRDPMGE